MNFKGGIGSLLTPVLMLWGSGNIDTRMEVSYCTFGFGTIIWRDLRISLLPRDLNPRRKGISCLMKLLDGLNYEKIRRYNNSPPYVTARWPPQQIPLLNFLDKTRQMLFVQCCFKFKNCIYRRNVIDTVFIHKRVLVICLFQICPVVKEGIC